MGLLPISYVFKKLSSYTFTFFLTCSVLGTILLPLPIRHFFFLCQILPTLQHRFQKPYPQSKTFFNVRTVLSSADFCSNAVLITIPSSSKHFFSLFDVLSNVPITSGMTLMILMFHILSISLFSSWYLSIFSFSFLLTLMSPGLAISVMAQLFSFLFTTVISGFLSLISVTLYHEIITSHKIFTSSFSATPSGVFSYHFSLLFRLHFPYNFQ